MAAAAELSRSSPISRSRVAALGALAATLFLTFLFFAFDYPRTPVLMSSPSARLISRFGLWSWIASLDVPVPHAKRAVAGVLLIATLVATASYVAAIALAWRRTCSTRLLVLVGSVAIAFFVIATLSLPNQDTDIYNYIATGRVAAHHHENPYVVPADRFPADSVYVYTNHAFTDEPGDNKLAAWTLIDIPLAKLGGTSVVRSLLVFRTAFLLFNAASLVLVVLILRRVWPQQRLAGLIAYGWNPIVVFEGQSKVDTVMVFFLLLGALLIVAARKWLGTVCLALSFLVKLITLPLVVVYWLRQLRRRRWRDAAVITLLLVLTTVIVYLPFWSGTGLIRKEVELVGSSGGASPPAPLKALLVIGLAALIALVAARLDGDRRGLLMAWTVVSLYFSAFLTHIGYSWYLMTLIALTSLSLDARLVAATAALSAAGFFLNTWTNASTGFFPLFGLANVPTPVLYAAPAGVFAAALTLFVQRERIRTFLSSSHRS